MKKKGFLVLLLFIALIAGLFARRIFFIKPQSVPALRKRAVEKTTVKAEPVERQDLDLILTYVGSLKAKDEAVVFSKVGGKLSGYVVNEGREVGKGQPIALIDRDETGLKYELADVDSPISGIVGRTFLDKGANVIAHSVPVAVVLDMDEMVVKLNIPEIDIPFIKRGLEARLKTDAYPAEDFTGEISKVSEVADALTRTFPVETTVPNPGHRLKSGMFARIDISAASHSGVLAVTQDALVKEDSQYYVYLVNDSTVRKIKVKPGIRQSNKIEILEGLEENQKVVVFGQQGLRDGSEVNVAE